MSEQDRSRLTRHGDARLGMGGPGVAGAGGALPRAAGVPAERSPESDHVRQARGDQHKRLAQMLDELERGDAHMKMPNRAGGAK